MASNLLETHQNKWFAPFLPRGPQSFMFKKSVLKLSVFGGLNGTLLPGNLSEKVGGEAPHLFDWFPGRRDSCPKAYDFRTDSNTNNKSRTSGGVRLRDRQGARSHLVESCAALPAPPFECLVSLAARPWERGRFALPRAKEIGGMGAPLRVSLKIGFLSFGLFETRTVNSSTSRGS